ncbi:hypothetical protein Bca101_006251 [Brassica carinata]
MDSLFDACKASLGPFLPTLSVSEMKVESGLSPDSSSIGSRVRSSKVMDAVALSVSMNSSDSSLDLTAEVEDPKVIVARNFSPLAEGNRYPPIGPPSVIGVEEVANWRMKYNLPADIIIRVPGVFPWRVVPPSIVGYCFSLGSGDHDRDLSHAPASVDSLAIGDSQHGHEMGIRIHPAERPGLKNFGLARYLCSPLAGYPLPQIHPVLFQRRSPHVAYAPLLQLRDHRLVPGEIHAGWRTRILQGPCLLNRYRFGGP